MESGVKEILSLFTSGDEVLQCGEPLLNPWADHGEDHGETEANIADYGPPHQAAPFILYTTHNTESNNDLQK